MTLSESARRDIFLGLEPVLGPDVANDLMSLLPSQPASELVTRADLHATTVMLRGEMAELRGELKGEMAELRGEMAELRAELKGEMAELRTELKDDMASLGAELRGEMNALRLSTQRWMSGAMAANTVALVTALVT